MQLGHLLLDFLGWVVVSFCQDERDRLGGEIAAADQPLVSLKDVEVSSGFRGEGGASFGFRQWVLRSLWALAAQVSRPVES